MVKLSELDLPIIFKKQLLFKSGIWNGLNISDFEVNKSPSNTKWNKLNKSLIFSHKDKEAEAWVGKVENVHSEFGKVYGDVHIFDPNTAIALKHGEAPFAISAGIAWEEKYEQPTNFFYRNFSLVSDPGVRDKEIFMNFNKERESIGGYKIASFSNELSSNTSQGEAIAQHVNEPSTKDLVPKQKKKKMRYCKMCKANYEDEEDEVCMPKDEFIEEHKNLVEILKSGTSEEQKKEAKDQAGELKEETKDFKCANMDKEEVKKDDDEEKDEKDESVKSDKNMTEKKEDEKNDSVKKEDMEVIDRIDDSHPTQMAMADVIKKKEWTMETLDSEHTIKAVNEENKVNYDLKTERRSKNMLEESNQKVPSVDSKTANFEAEKTPEKSEVKEVPKEEVKTEKMTNASPMVDEKFINEVVDKIVTKIKPTPLVPAPVTTQEFTGQSGDLQEEAVERLAKVLIRK